MNDNSLRNRAANVEIKDAVLYLLGLVTTGLTFWLKTQKEELDTVKREFSQLSLKVVGEYATRAEVEKITEDFSGKLDKVSAAIFKKLDSIEEKLDRKADKSEVSK